MRKINLLLIGIFLFAGNLFSQTFTQENITYQVSSSTGVTVIGHTITSTTDLVIPSDVTYGGDMYLVESIADNTFEDCYYLTDVTLPSTILSVGESAFKGCENITMLTHNGEGAIGDYAFKGCTRLIDIILSDWITSIGEWAFEHCNIITINFPKNLTSIA